VSAEVFDLDADAVVGVVVDVAAIKNAVVVASRYMNAKMQDDRIFVTLLPV